MNDPDGTNVSSSIHPSMAAAFAIGIFIADTFTHLEIAVAVLYVSVVLMAARFLPGAWRLVGLRRMYWPDRAELLFVLPNITNAFRGRINKDANETLKTLLDRRFRESRVESAYRRRSSLQ